MVFSWIVRHSFLIFLGNSLVLVLWIFACALLDGVDFTFCVWRFMKGKLTKIYGHWMCCIWFFSNFISCSLFSVCFISVRVSFFRILFNTHPFVKVIFVWFSINVTYIVLFHCPHNVLYFSIKFSFFFLTKFFFYFFLSK